MIRKRNGRWVLLSKRTHRVLGTHRTKRQAERQETAIRLSKLRAQGRIPRRR